VITQNKELADRIRQCYTKPVAAGQAPLARRLMYGTDWNLLVREGDIRPCFDEFVKLFEEIDKEIKPVGDLYSPSQRFFGQNAVDWMGLKSGKARTRLEGFYARNQVDLNTDPMHWTKKVG
jgi:hypothetical protein